MEEFDYEIVENDFMETTNKVNYFRNIYEFDANSVINVFTSEKGSVMFEVTGVREEDTELSSLEKLRIKESMDDFCEKYPIIKEKFKAKGIDFTNEKLAKAHEKYARKIELENNKLLSKRKQRNSKTDVKKLKKEV